MTTQGRFRVIATLVAVLGTWASPLMAQDIGVRVGVSAEPNQFYFGADYETPPLVEQLHFRPNAEIGIGDETTLTGLNFEFVYRFAGDYPWKLYGGAGPALNFIDTDLDTKAEGGFNILFGAMHSDGLFVEVKAGALHSPRFKFGVGYLFR